MRYFALLLICTCFQFSFAQEHIKNPLLSEDPIKQQQWVDSLYNSMSLAERIGQLYMVQVMSENSDKVNNKVVDLIKKQHIGGVIYSNGGPVRQARLNNELQAASKIPLLIGMDAEWGFAISKNPYISFKFAGKSGDKLKLSWTDNLGKSDSLETKVK